MIFSKFVPSRWVKKNFPHNHSIFSAIFFICFHQNSRNVFITILIQTMLTNILCSLFESMKKKELRKLLTHFLKVKNGQSKGNDKEKIQNHDKIQTNFCSSSTRASSLLGRNVSPAFRFFQLYNGSLRCLKYWSFSCTWS